MLLVLQLDDGSDSVETLDGIGAQKTNWGKLAKNPSQTARTVVARLIRGRLGNGAAPPGWATVHPTSEAVEGQGTARGPHNRSLLNVLYS